MDVERLRSAFWELKSVGIRVFQLQEEMGVMIPVEGPSGDLEEELYELLKRRMVLSREWGPLLSETLPEVFSKLDTLERENQRLKQELTARDVGGDLMLKMFTDAAYGGEPLDYKPSLFDAIGRVDILRRWSGERHEWRERALAAERSGTAVKTEVTEQ